MAFVFRSRLRKEAIYGLLFLLMLVPSVGVTAAEAYSLLVDDSSTYPDVITAGDTVTLNIAYKFTDLSGSIQGAGASISLNEEHFEPIKVEAFLGDFKKREIKTASFRFKVKSSTSPGVYKITTTTKWKGVYGESFATDDVDITVSDVEQRPHVTLLGSAVLDGRVLTESDFNLEITVKNIGSSRAKNIEIELLLGELPIVALNGNTVFIQELAEGEEKKAVFNLYAGKNARSQTYHLPLLIRYWDISLKKQFEEEKAVGVVVLADAQLNLSKVVLEQDITKLDEKGLVLSVRVENAGNGPAKNVQLKLDTDIPSDKTVFLGEIRPGEDLPAVFRIKPNRQGQAMLGLTISYEDELGTHSEAVSTDVYFPEQSLDLLSLLGILLVVIGGLGAIAYYRKTKK